MTLGVTVGLCGGAIVSGVAAFLPQLLTHDTALWPLLGQVVIQALVSMVFTGIDVCGCAINIAVGWWGCEGVGKLTTMNYKSSVSTGILCL